MDNFGDNDNKPNQATQLVNLINQYPVSYDQDNRVFIRIAVKGHVENWEIGTKKFEEWLSHQYFIEYARTANKSSLGDAVTALRGKAQHEGLLQHTFLRCAKDDSGYYLDLANPQWAIVHVEPGRWTGKGHCDAMFYRNDSTQQLPLPRHNGTIDPLWECVNIPEKDQLLVVAFLIDSLRPDTHHPLLVFDGEQGSAKSTTQQRLKELIDPSAMLLRTEPNKPQDLYVAAANDYVLSYNNLSHLKRAMQDALCCLSTGSTFATRALYTNNSEVVVNFMRPVMINGIGTLVTQQDLLERSIYIELPTIDGSARRTDRELNSTFAARRGDILGGLLNVMAKALAILPTVASDNLPRMADFCLLGRSIAVAMGRDAKDFDRSYADNQRRAIEKGLDSCPIYPALVKLIANSPLGFYDNYIGLLQRLERHLDYRPDNWPKSPKALASLLKRQAPALRKIGVSVIMDPKRYEDGYRVGIDRIP